MMKNLLRSSPSTKSLLPRETSSVLKRLAMRLMIASGSFEKSGTLRSDSGGNEAAAPETSTPIRSALGSSTFVRLTRYVPPSTCTHGSMLNSHRGVIDIILGDVLVVSARFLATDVVTLRCNKPLDMVPPTRLVSQPPSHHCETNIAKRIQMPRPSSNRLGSRAS